MNKRIVFVGSNSFIAKNVIFELKHDERLKSHKVIIFTESAETGSYLLKNLYQSLKRYNII